MGAMATCEFYYDFSSPFSYLAATQVERVCEGHALVWKPFVLGGLFKTIGAPVVPLATFGPAKIRMAMADLYRWADHWGVEFEFAQQFPQKTITALRVALQASDAVIGPLSVDLFRQMWVQGHSLEDPATVAGVAERHGLDPEKVIAGCQDPDVKARLRTNTEEAAARGVFGAPSFVVGDSVFWGQDRLDFVKKALGGWTVDCGAKAESLATGVFGQPQG